MKRKNLFLLVIAAFMTCGTGMLLTSCSDDDNNSSSKNKPADSDNYEIEVEAGMRMNENEFQTKVPATTDCDQAVIAALQAIDKVTDVKAFKMNVYSFQKDKMVKKTAYFFNFKQDIDHNNPSKGWFKQQCVLTVAGKDRPTVLMTEGYALGNATPELNVNRLDSLAETPLVETMNANCLQVEHRYHGWSLPEGWTNKWNYLSAKQQSDDLHAIVTAIKGSGIISKSSKWLSTGGSKGGETTAFYAYHYPNEMDAYVPFVAPFLLSTIDTRPFTYILEEGHIGNNMQKVKAAFRAFFRNKELQEQTAELFRKDKKLGSQYSVNDLCLSLMLIIYDNHFQKMSYVPYTKWLPLVPKEGDSAEKFYKYIMADATTRYSGDSNTEYDTRVDGFYDLEGNSNAFDLDTANLVKARTRATVTTKERFNPYEVQCAKELGASQNVYSWVVDLVSPLDMSRLNAPVCDPKKFGVNYDGGAFIRQFLSGMKLSDCYMFFVYGLQDPWTGACIPEEYLGKNSQVLFIKNGIHNDFIAQWDEAERNQLLQWLKGLGFEF